MKVGDKVSHCNDGQRGTLIDVDGVMMVQLDRPSGGLASNVVPYSEKVWFPAPRALSLNPSQKDRIVYSALYELQRCRAKWGAKPWDRLTDREKQDFRRSMPTDEEELALWSVMYNVLDGESK